MGDLLIPSKPFGHPPLKRDPNKNNRVTLELHQVWVERSATATVWAIQKLEKAGEGEQHHKVTLRHYVTQ